MAYLFNNCILPLWLMNTWRPLVEKKHVTKIHYDVGQDKKAMWMSEWIGYEGVYTQKHKRTP